MLRRRTGTLLALVATSTVLLPAWHITQQNEPQVAELINRLETRDWERAVDGLVKMGEPAVEPLIAALVRPERFIPGRAAIALARIGTPRAADAVYGALQSPNNQTKSHAITALGYLKTARAEAALIDIVRNEQGSTFRQDAARTLAGMGSTSAVGPIATMLEDRQWYNRAAAAQLLGRLKSADAVPALLNTLEDPARPVQLDARKALVAIGRPAVPQLTAALKTAGGGVRWQLVWALGRIGSAQVLDSLLDSLTSSDWMVRSEAAVALARLEDPAVDQRILPLLNDRNPDVREDAAWTIARRRSPGAAAFAPAPLASLQAPDLSPRPANHVSYEGRVYPSYPATTKSPPALPSPWKTPDGQEYVVARTGADEWAVCPVTLGASVLEERQLRADAVDFPALATRGLHSDIELGQTRVITSRSIAEVTDLGRPGQLSVEGFMTAEEDIISVLAGDNRLVARMGLTHPDLARPLLHVWNMIQTDLKLNRWNMAEHRWENIQQVLYNGGKVLLDARDTKGVQDSIFEDKLEGYFGITIRRELTGNEEAFLRRKYGHLPADRVTAMKEKLSRIQTGEMEPYYIMWYGFYEGHTPWRTDPIAIAFIFGLRSLEEIEQAFPGELNRVLAEPFTKPATRAQPQYGILPLDPNSAQRIALIDALRSKGPALADAFKPHVFRNAKGEQMPYRLFTPARVEPGRTYPLVVFLHGAGGSGADNARQLQGANVFGGLVWTLPENQQRFPAFVLAPQSDVNWPCTIYDPKNPPKTLADLKYCPPDALGLGAGLAFQIIDSLLGTLPIDRSRIYVTGHSMGGAGAWHMIAQRPRFFAAAVPVCGHPLPATAKTVKDVPVWNFHGAADEIEPVTTSRVMIEALRKIGGQPRHTEYAGVGHDVFMWAYTEPALIEWLFAQRRRD